MGAPLLDVKAFYNDHVGAAVDFKEEYQVRRLPGALPAMPTACGLFLFSFFLGSRVT
jgi:hypothetical protein